MSKICILSAVNIKHMSLISLYTQRLIRDGIDFDIIYMDKYGEDEDFPAKRKYAFTNKVKHELPRFVKVFQYFKFRKFAIPIIKKNDYDFIIVWNDVAIFMFADYLARCWKNKYCLNIRDYSSQNKKLLRRRYERVIKNSAFTTISSDAFEKFLPPHDYVHVHSLNMDVLSTIEPRKSFRKAGEPIRITFIGNVRFFEPNKKLLDVFKNDDRFELGYYGTNANVLRDYANENGIKNAVFHDAFPLAQTADFIRKTDVINNLYGSRVASLDNALSIKLYYGVYGRMPVLVNKGTHSDSLTSQYGIGFGVEEISKNFKEEFFEWYTSLNFEAFNKGCQTLLDKIEAENQSFESCYTKFLK
ncbi:MAG: glycosyltransferase family 4 protein [Clostridiales bacterium]|nr:glycosyltransferase family 4 protein [Clostridiales bacterium]